MEDPIFERKPLTGDLGPGAAPNQDLIPNKTAKRKKPFFFYFLIVFVLVLSGFLGVRAWIARNQSGNPGYGQNILQPKKFGFLQTVKNFLFARNDGGLSGQENDRINILLLGIGGPGHDGPYLSDTNIIVSIKPSTREVAMISIPRDLGVKIENYGTYRVNYADALGENKNPGQGGEYARQIFSQTFNLDIPYYVRVDFSAFEQMIDAVGGVEVTVTNPFVDYSFPGPNYSYQTVSFASGTQMMNGETALKYARSRHGTNGENSDFARSRRQQQILSALKQKLFSFGTFTSPATIQKIWSSLANNISTNLNIGEIIYLAGLAKDIDTGKVKNLVIDSSPNGYLYSYIAQNGAFMLAPKNNNFDAINLSIANIFDQNFKPVIPAVSTVSYATNGRGATDTVQIVVPSTSTQRLDFLESAKIEIQNGTWRAGLASRYQTSLSDQGFSIITIGNSYKRPIPATTIYLINQSVKNDIVNYLAKQIKGKIEMTLPEWLHDDYDDPATVENEMGAKFNPDTDILVILGTNAE